MKKIITTINKHGQVTVPAAVRRVLGVEPGDKLTFIIENGQIRLERAAFTLESAYGSVRASKRPEDFEQLSRAAKESKAEEYWRKA